MLHGKAQCVSGLDQSHQLVAIALQVVARGHRDAGQAASLALAQAVH
jgi:hypothetical protein